MSALGSPRLVSLAALLAVACGDRLVGGSYRGDPLLTLEGRVSLAGRFADPSACEEPFGRCTREFEEQCGGEERAPDCDGAEEACFVDYEACVEALPDDDGRWLDDPRRLRMALFWEAVGGGGAVTSVEQGGATSTTFPARYELALFRPPPEAALRPVPEGQGRFALALLLVYYDGDLDGAWSPASDRIVGGAVQRAVLFTPEGIDDPGLGAWPGGYHTAAVGTECSEGGSSYRVLSEADAQLDLELSVAPEFLSALLLDVNCDGEREGELCPPPDEVAELCEREERDPWLCETCLRE